jgi:hypothetical protein
VIERVIKLYRGDCCVGRVALVGHRAYLPPKSWLPCVTPGEHVGLGGDTVTT